MCMYIVNLHIILKDHQRDKKKKRLVSVFTGFRHRASQSTRSYSECFQLNKSVEGVQYFCLTLDRTQTTDFFSLYGRKKGQNVNAFCKARVCRVASYSCQLSGWWFFCVCTRPVAVVCLFRLLLFWFCQRLLLAGLLLRCHFGVHGFCVCLSDSATGAKAPPVGRCVKWQVNCLHIIILLQRLFAKDK